MYVHDGDSCGVKICIGISNWDITNGDVGHRGTNFTRMEINKN